MTILSTVTPQSFGNSLLLLQLDLFNSKKLQRKQQSVEADFTSDINGINLQADKWRSVQQGLEDAANFLGKTISRGDNIRSLLDKMISGAYMTVYGDSNSFRAQAAAFDSRLRSLENAAQTTGDSPNLLGSLSQSDYSFYTDVNGAAHTVSRSYIGSDYTIKEAGDYIWKRDLDYNYLKRYVYSTDQYTGTYVNLSTGAIRLDSFTSATDSVTFTTAYDTADATQYTGALTRTGLKILDSWLYDEFTTTDGRSRANTDLNYAKVTLDFVLPTFTSALDMAQYYQGRVDTQIAGFDSLIDEKTSAALIELQSAESDSNRLSSLNSAFINSTARMRLQYMDALSLGGPSALAKALIDVVA